MTKELTQFGAVGEDGSHGDAVDRLKPFIQHATGEVVPEGERTSVDDPDSGLAGPSEPPNPLDLAKKCYENSTEYMSSSLRSQWERNERAFQSQHPSGSKYLSAAYKHRSALFRPKTRAAIRQGEAQAAASYFSNEDIVNLGAANPGDKNNQAAADLMKEVLQNRLTSGSPRTGVPWFTTVIGAYQEAQKLGAVCSKQWWEYRYREQRVPTGADDQGRPTFQTKRTIIKDRPRVTLYPLENVRIDRSAEWQDPVNSSPFLILMQPMYIHEAQERMRLADPFDPSKKQWLTVDASTLKSASGRHKWDPQRAARQPGRDDPHDSDIGIDEYTVIWAHENFVWWDNQDWVYWTAGVHALLSEPRPIEEVYPYVRSGERPVVMGSFLVEPHKTYSSGKPQLTQNLQTEANDIANLRLDNVKLALNKRFLVRRGRQVDLRSLTRSVPGSITFVTDIEGDVREMETRDVTSSSFQEQNLLNVDFDEIAGVFSPGTVQTNRRMNETVGGMQLLSGSSNLISELDLRTFTETWAEPVIRQLVAMERFFENDVTILAIAGEKAQLFQKYGIERIDDDLLEQETTVRVNVGIGATDPMQRLKKFVVGAEAAGKIFGDKLLPFLDAEEVLKEIFAPLGYRDGQRFFRFNRQDPMVQMLMAEIQKMAQELQARTADNNAKVDVARIGGMSRIIQQYVENEGNKNLQAAEFMQEMMAERTRQAGEIQRTRETADREDMRLRQEHLSKFAQVAQQGRNAERVARMKQTTEADGADA